VDPVRVSSLFLACAFLFLCSGAFLGGEQDVLPLAVYMFAASSCEECKNIEHTLVPELAREFGGRIRYIRMHVDEEPEFELQLLYEKHYRETSDEAVKVFVGTQCVAGEKAIVMSLRSVILNELQKGSQTPSPADIRAAFSSVRGGTGRTGSTDDVIADRFSALTLGLVLVAGLADGLNPCAFVTLVFFISVLQLLGKTRREIASVGIVFCLAVFLTYLMLGMGILRAVKEFSVSAGVSLVLRYGAACLCFILAAMSIGDVLRYRRSRESKDVHVKLPAVLRKMVNHFINREMRGRYVVAGAALTGIVVSLLESLCTGQVYLPTIMFVYQSGRSTLKALVYLAAYNLAFVLPLLGVFAVACFGVGSSALARWHKEHLVLAKVIMVVIFTVLGAVLVL
jgi:hypothetical protein